MHCDPFVIACERITIERDDSKYGVHLVIKFDGPSGSFDSYKMNVWGDPELIIDSSVTPKTGRSADSMRTACDRYEPAESPKPLGERLTGGDK